MLYVDAADASINWDGKGPFVTDSTACRLGASGTFRLASLCHAWLDLGASFQIRR